MMKPLVRSTLRRAAQAATLGACVLLVLGCQPGYPTEDMVDADHPPTAAALLHKLKAMGKDAAMPENWRFDLLAPCKLRLRGRPDGGPKVSTILPLLTLQVGTSSDPAAGTIAVTLRRQDGTQPRHWRVYETEHWYDAASFSSQLRQLQLRCAETRPTR
jgi:hypothetical protein